MKYNKIVIGSIVLIVIALIYMWWSSTRKGPADGVTIVTPMPVSGYSINDDGFDSRGIAQGLPETLSPLEPSLAVDATQIPTSEPDVISAMSTAAAVPTTKAAAVETYRSYAPKNWNGRIL